MIARHFLKMSVVALFLFPTAILAQGVLQPTKGPALPDLVVADMTLRHGCIVVVTIRNNGPGPVPEAGYASPGGSGVWIGYASGAYLAGIALGWADYQHLSQPVGGVASMWSNWNPLPPGDHVIKANVDNNHSIAESNELNNSLTKTFSCRPDLQPTAITLVPTGIMVGSPCRIVVTLRNNGPAHIPETGYGYGSAPDVSVKMWNGSAAFGGPHYLRTIDSSRELQPAGATKTYAYSSYLQLAAGVPHVLRLELDGANTLVESNEANNTLTQTLPCGIAPTTNAQ